MADLDAFEPMEVEVEELQLEVLVASRRALLKPERRERRIDIIVSSVLAVLAGRGSLGRDALRQAVSALWKTGSITRPLFDGALETAAAAGLITQQPGLDDKTRFEISAGAKADLTKDREWVNDTLAGVKSEVEKRLFEYPDQHLGGAAEKISVLVIRAVAHGLVDYAIEQPGADQVLVPIEIDEKDVARFAGSLQPKSHREPVGDMALAALDPDDSFGNEIVHLIVAGHLLHGIVTQRGGSPGSLKGVKLLLDTSVLTSLASSDSPEGRILMKAIQVSVDLGVEVFVAQHTVEEWNRQWDVADEEARAITGNTIPILASRFEQNPFLRSYLRAVEKPEDLPYAKWSVSLRDLPRMLAEVGVKVVRHGISGKENAVRVETIRQALRGTGRRSVKGAEADAHSAIMVAMWREDGGPDTAFFVAAERFTGEAFSEHIDSKHSLIVSPHAWLVYASNLGVDDPDQAADIADLIASAIVRKTMFELACSYSFEEILVLSEILMDAGTITPRDVREIGIPQLFELEELAAPDLTPDQQAARLLRVKARRETDRAKRLEAAAGEVRKKASQESEQAARAIELERQRSQRLADELAKASKERDRETDRAQRATQRTSLVIRRFVVGFLVAGLVSVVVVGHLLDWWSLWVTVLAAAVLILIGLRSLAYLTKPEASASSLLVPIVGETALLVVGFAIEMIRDTGSSG